LRENEGDFVTSRRDGRERALRELGRAGED
jgi:hypothetical protein